MFILTTCMVNLQFALIIVYILVKTEICFTSVAFSKITNFHSLLWSWSLHCLKSARIWSYSGPNFPAFGLNTDVSLRIQPECRKMRTRIAPNMDTFHAVLLFAVFDMLFKCPGTNYSLVASSAWENWCYHILNQYDKLF